MNKLPLALFISLIICIGLVPTSAFAASPTEHQFVADVDGDGDDDSIVFFADVGTWYVAKSNGSSFDTPTGPWISGHGVGSTKQFVADVTCDGKADAVIFIADTGSWFVAASDGTKFTNGDPNFSPYLWLTGAGVGSVAQMLGDQHNTLCSDAVVTFPDGSWWEYDSPGNATWSSKISGLPVDLQRPPNQRYSSGLGVGATTHLFADVTEDGQADAIVFYGNTGSWYVSRYGANGKYGFPELWIKGHGVGSAKQMISQRNGAANAVVYRLGKWSQAPSVADMVFNPDTGGWDTTGNPANRAFYVPVIYPPACSRYGLWSDNQLSGDVSGTNQDTFVSFYNNNGTWYSMNTYDPALWISGHGAGSR